MKDPAVLIYFDKWISSTNGMRADFRAWYFDLIIHQYDKGFVPLDLDELAGICRVRPSEYDSFKQMVEQVVKQKFEIIEGVYHNKVIGEVLTKRQEFKDKRERSGNIGVIIKSAKAISWCTEAMLLRLKDHLFSLEINEILKLKDNQVLEQMLKLYINEDVDEDINITPVKIKEYNNTDFDFSKFWSLYPKKVGSKEKCEKAFDKLSITDRQKIESTLSVFIKHKPFETYTLPYPQTYLNNKRWNDEIPLQINNISIKDERFKELTDAIRSADSTI